MGNVHSEVKSHFGLLFGMVLTATVVVGCFGIMLTKYMNANLAKYKSKHAQTAHEKVNVPKHDGSTGIAYLLPDSDPDTALFKAQLKRHGYTFDPNSGKLTKSTSSSSIVEVYH